MHIRTTLLATVLLLSATALFVGNNGFSFVSEDELAKADQHFADKNYKLALASYENVLVEKGRPIAQSGHAFLQSARCEERLKKWDEALARLAGNGSRPFVGSIWEPRVLALRGGISLTMRHYYYKKGDIISRDRWIQGATYHYTHNEDLRSSLNDLEKAVLLFGPFLEKGILPIGDERLASRVAEYTKYSLQMVHAIEQHRSQHGGFNGGEVHKNVLADLAKHNLCRTLGHDPIAWLERAEKMALLHEEKTAASLARYELAMFCRRLLSSLHVHKVRSKPGNEIACQIGTDENNEPITVVLPKRLNPFIRLKEFLKKYPKSPWADDAAYSQGRLSDEHGLYLQALAAVKDFKKRYPKSKWLSDVLGLRQSITYPELSVQAEASFLPGKPVKLNIKTRNVGEVTVKTQSIDLEKLFSDPHYLKDRKSALNQLERNLKPFFRARGGSPFSGERATFKTPDRAAHRRHEIKPTIPLTEVGAYIVQIEGSGVTVRSLVVISNIAIVRKISRDETVVFVAHATEGTPIDSAHVLVKQLHRADGLFGRYAKVTFNEGETDGAGLFKRAHADSNHRDIRIEAFASMKGHFAMTSLKQFTGVGARQQSIRAHGFTDRPVFRPSDPVHFKAHFCSQKEADYSVLANERIKVRITDARGNKIFEQFLVTDEYGALWADLTLGEEPPLGSYQIEYRKGTSRIYSHSFRVEEYKLPEFEVSVNGPAEQVRVGDRVKATIHGEYYSGGGVPEAKVAWRIYRRAFYPTFRRSDPWAWLYASRNGRRPSRGRELVARGEGVTDASGDLIVEFDTKPWGDKYAKDDHLFSIEADMTDLSRRTISGAGVTRVTRRGLFAALFGERGFYQAGESIALEVLTQNADGIPKESIGRFIVYRETRFRKGNEISTHRTQIHVEEGTTDEGGRGEFRWQSDSAGRFVISYVTEDQWGEPVIGEYTALVADVNARSDEFQDKDIELVADRREYKPGDTALLLINSQFADQTVLLTLEADNEFLMCRVVKLKGRSTVVSIPILESHAPNIHFQVMGIHGGIFMATHQQIFVPPTHRFVDVAMDFDKKRYGPGDMAKVSFRTTNHKGEAVPASIGFAVFDKALTYIQNASSADMRQVFYGRLRSFYGAKSWRGNLENSSGFRFSGYRVATPVFKKYRTHGAPPGYWRHGDGGGTEYFAQAHSTRLGTLGGLTIVEKNRFVRGSDSDKLVLEESEAIPMTGGTIRRAGGRGIVAGSPNAPSLRRRNQPKGGGSFGKKVKKGSVTRDLGNAPVAVRKNFSDLAFWQADVETDQGGYATIQFKLPDTLTTWVARARGVSADVLVGEANSAVQTAKDLLVRLQAPRFFTEQDEVVLSAVVRNDRPMDLEVETSLSLSGESLELLEGSSRKVTVKARSESRVNWRVRVLSKGQVTVLLKALSAQESDAVSLSFGVLPYGIDKVVTQSAVLDGDGSQTLVVDLPAARREGSGELDITLSPSMAGSLMEALPYLVEYPYGCTEQTISRFLPAVVVAKTLQDQGVSLEDIQKHRSEIENKAALNVRINDPVYSREELDRLVRSGLRRLASLQNGDGGWGWWSRDKSTVHLTSYVLYGLSLARDCDYKVSNQMIKRGANWLEGELKDGQSPLHQKAYAALALTACGRSSKALLDDVMKKRDDLTALSKAWLALALHQADRLSEAALVVQNLDDFRLEDKRNGTSHWASASSWWTWWGDEVETNAFVLLAASTIAPKTPWIDGLAKWLVFNRVGNRWKSTRDTAHAVLALARFASGAGEFDPDYTVTISYPGREPFSVKVNKGNMFTFERSLLIADADLRGGPQKLTIQKKGKGRLYLNSRLRFFSKEDRIQAAGHQIEVQRAYFALTPKEVEKKSGNRTITVIEYDRTPLPFDAKVEAGQEVEVRLTLDVANNYEYVMVEDRKPSGFETVALRSGGRYMNGLCSNMELRDEKVVFFVSWLQQGSHEITYRMRAEMPGTIASMPCRAVAMYAPRLGGISDSWRVTVSDPTR